jgi:hypothetical protein
VPGWHRLLPSQHPVGQEVPSHWQPVVVQCWPDTQDAPPLQEHAPLVHPLSSVVLHAAQAAPPAPQAPVPTLVMQVVPLQHPEQLVESHWHPVAVQCWPATQAAPPLQVQFPLVQALVRVVLQAEQRFPPEPQSPVVVPPTHAPDAQQPLGQLVGLHTQLPPEQVSPAAHALPVPPHSQVRLVALQVSVGGGAHTTQLFPPVPQAAATLPVLHIPDSQQPLGQSVGLHPEQVPEMHIWPVGQVWQATPPTPQVWSFEVLQVVPLQQPLEQLVPSHTHAPLRQRCPATQRLPPGPQLQAPETHRSASVALQARQVLPGGPHSETLVAMMHWFEAQQPPVQLDELHTHAPD